jgi:hypothetical protein
MPQFIYKFVENHVPREVVLPSSEEAVRRAVRDMDSGVIYPKEVVQVVLDRRGIQEAWERQQAA